MPSYEENGIIALTTLIRFDESDDLHLINASQKGDFDEVEKLLKENKENLDYRVNALQKGDFDEVEKLLKENKKNPELDLDYRDSDGATALFYAASKGYDKILKALIANGANKDIANYNGETPLFKACSEGHLLVVEQLGKAGVDVNKGKEDVATSIESYLHKRFHDNVEKGVGGTTPLHAASAACHHLVVRELLRLGADVEGLEGEQSPLWLAIGLRNHEIVRELINSGADVNKAIPGSPSPLFLAIQNGDHSVANELISSGADVNKAFKGVMPIYEACEKNYNDIAKALFKAGADVGCLQESGWLYGTKLKEELESELVGDEMRQLIKEFINPENIKNRDKELANRRKPNNEVDPLGAKTIVPIDLVR